MSSFDRAVKRRWLSRMTELMLDEGVDSPDAAIREHARLFEVLLDDLINQLAPEEWLDWDGEEGRF